MSNNSGQKKTGSTRVLYRVFGGGLKRVWYLNLWCPGKLSDEKAPTPAWVQKHVGKTWQMQRLQDQALLEVVTKAN